MNFFNWFKPSPNLASTILHDEYTFYQAFLKDLKGCEKEVIIESPFITSSRIRTFYPIFKRILDRGTKVHIITRDPIDHDGIIRHQATNEILCLSELGVNVVLLKGNHHRKLAIIDRKIIWEDSLNILSQRNSREIMRRVASEDMTGELILFLKLDVIIGL